jgi:hypothetical protein
VEWDWRRVLLHEAGHAVAAIWLLGETANIVAMNFTDEGGKLRRKASFEYQPQLVIDVGVEPDRPFEHGQYFVAGGVAETLFFSGEAQGANGDLSKLDGYMIVLKGKAPLSWEALRAEVDEGFPKTKSLLTEHLDAVKRIGEAAFSEFQKRGLDKAEEFQRTVVLPAEEVLRLFHQKPEIRISDSNGSEPVT